MIEDLRWWQEQSVEPDLHEIRWQALKNLRVRFPVIDELFQENEHNLLDESQPDEETLATYLELIVNGGVEGLVQALDEEIERITEEIRIIENQPFNVEALKDSSKAVIRFILAFAFDLSNYKHLLTLPDSEMNLGIKLDPSGPRNSAKIQEKMMVSPRLRKLTSPEKEQAENFVLYQSAAEKLFEAAKVVRDFVARALVDLKRDWITGQNAKPLEALTEELVHELAGTRKGRKQLLLTLEWIEVQESLITQELTGLQFEEWSVRAFTNLFEYLSVQPFLEPTNKATLDKVEKVKKQARNGFIERAFWLFQYAKLSPEQIFELLKYEQDQLEINTFLHRFNHREINSFFPGVFAEIRVGLEYLKDGYQVRVASLEEEPQLVDLVAQKGDEILVVQVKGSAAFEGTEPIDITDGVPAGKMLLNFSSLQADELRKTARRLRGRAIWANASTRI